MRRPETAAVAAAAAAIVTDIEISLTLALSRRTGEGRCPKAPTISDSPTD